ncbi:carbohydrate-binding protein [Lacrimispora sp.]|uniref:carbohydrate-binding protein n=1 Tax=Lacrimispora sp. TaxID=2719234 RepID=UPI0028A6A362|nr:carbohydrate-binding protein [Lacrimispora sp.]
MANVSIAIKNQNGEVKASILGEDQAILVFEGEYVEGDAIVFTTDKTGAHYVVRIDDCMDESFVYLTKEKVVYTIPFGEKKISYNPEAFTGERHYLTIREAFDYEADIYRNLAKNVMDQHGDTGCFPHAFANVETRGEAVFAARNAIDGVLANESHGAWPYESWGINRQDDAEMTLDFGRPVDFDKIVLYTRADFPHDNWWVKAKLTFSDGTEGVVEMEKSVKPHLFSLERKNITWVKISDLIKADDPSPFPALTQIEVYGKDSK